MTKLGVARVRVRDVESLVQSAIRNGRDADADTYRLTQLIPALYAALEAAAPAAPFDRPAAEEAFAEAYSAAAYGWALSAFDAEKARLTRNEAAAILALVRSGKMHEAFFDAGIPITK